MKTCRKIIAVILTSIPMYTLTNCTSDKNNVISFQAPDTVHIVVSIAPKSYCTGDVRVYANDAIVGLVFPSSGIENDTIAAPRNANLSAVYNNGCATTKQITVDTIATAGLVWEIGY